MNYNVEIWAFVFETDSNLNTETRIWQKIPIGLASIRFRAKFIKIMG